LLLPGFLFVKATGFFPDIDNWNKQEVKTYSGNNLFDYINGAAETYVKYNFIEMRMLNYVKEKNYITVEVYRHLNTENALGIYKTERPSMPVLIDCGYEGYMVHGGINFCNDSFYIKISYNLNSNESKETALVIASLLSDQINTNPSLPNIYSIFEKQNMINGSEHFIADAYLGYHFFNNAYTITYQVSGNQYESFIIKFPDNKALRKTLKVYLSAVNAPKKLSKQLSFTLIDPNSGMISFCISGNMLQGLSGTSEKAIHTGFIQKCSQKQVSGQ
jgi:hypothetical protein